jgi:hypothetical protein
MEEEEEEEEGRRRRRRRIYSYSIYVVCDAGSKSIHPVSKELN